jgi:hypothetical protein
MTTGSTTTTNAFAAPIPQAFAGTSGKSLARTGFNAAPLALTGIGAMLIGGFLCTASRRVGRV